MSLHVHDGGSMALYKYVKEVSKRKKDTRIFSFVFLLVGTGILFWTIWPIMSFALFTDPILTKIISPVAANENSQTSDDPTLNANTWFPTQPQKKVTATVNSYLVSIPRLKIENATAIIGGDDLAKSLIHYGGTALPGEYGNAVIFGHSTLPQFYNPKDYKAIFSTLPTLKIGDEIFITYDGVTYRYVIFEMTVTDPDDLSPLEQRYDDSYVTLITCVPPGTTWRRLNVKARLARLKTS